MVSINGNSSLGAMHAPPPPQRPTATEVTNSFFAAVDPTGSGSFDKNALNSLADKVSISPAAVDAMFSLLDSNADGSVTKQEFTDVLQTIKPQGDSPSSATPPTSPPGGMRPAGGGPPPPMQAASSTTSTDPADTNGDGTVSAVEALAYSQASAISANTTDSADGSTNTTNRGEDLIVSNVMNMISSYALADKNQGTAESSWYG